jgi:hypothetical protein
MGSLAGGCLIAIGVKNLADCSIILANSKSGGEDAKIRIDGLH